MAARTSHLPSNLPNDFGSFLKILRRRAHLTQTELGLAVGYSEAHISRLENNQRLPDLATIAALFIPILDLNREPELAARLLALAEAARGKSPIQPGPDQPALDTLDIVGAIESLPRLPADWVRPHALQHLREQWAHERLILLYGLPGMGKTTLVAALAAEVTRTSPVFWLTFTDGLTASVESLIHQLALFTLTLGRDTAAPLLAKREPQARALQLEEQLAVLNQALAGQECLLCFDHFHPDHQNPSLLQAIQHLAATTAAHILLISREEISLPEFTPLHIKGLTQEEAAELVNRLGVTLSSAQSEQLFRKTAGNPMLLRLASVQLRETNAAAEVSTFISHLETAPSVSAYLLATVLDSLSIPARRLAECLSILRAPVDLTDEGLIERSNTILGGDGSGWHEAVREIQRWHLVEHPRTALLHPLLGDYIFTTLGNEPQRRHTLHQLMADWLAENPEEALPAAYHYSRARDFKRAVEVLTDQAETIIDLAQTDVALPLIDELLGQARRQRPPEWLRALLTLRGDLLTHTIQAPEAEINYREALILTDEPAARAQITIRLAQNLLLRQRAAEALALCEAATGGLSLEKFPLIRAEIAILECQAHLTLSQFDSASAAAENALQLARQVMLFAPRQATQLEAQVHLSLGALAGIHGDVQAARHHWQTAIVTARATGAKIIECRAHTNLGITLYQEGDFAGSLEHYQAALLGAQTFADSVLVARVLSNMAILHHLLGELETAFAEAEQARQLRSQFDDRLGLANLDNTRASILLAQHRFPEAQKMAETVILEAERLEHHRLLGYALDTFAQIQLAQGNGKTAFAALERALELPEIQQDASLFGDLQRHRALVQLADGNLTQAEQILASLPEGDASPKTMIEGLIMGAWLAFRQNEIPAAQERLALAQARIEASGCRLYQNAATYLAQALHGDGGCDLRFALI